ncbi:hypothetical protein SPI_00978 [Niveomyces insectorum RCEF 264]|uniref:Uncharacterized protein n=1 Tax=Niveomyces insectorum RCEF 264 TaxID=1081102 RepID=A0A168AI76_9HYPO|nr:hypothetical protein SPI_00978 [Niveomyces insectorum RCEF 264]
MVQRKLEFYVPRPAPPERLPGASCFLDLPYGVRHRIYVLAGLVRVCPINLNLEGLRAEALRTGAQPITGCPCFYQARRSLGSSSGGGGGTFDLDHVPGCECAALPIALVCVSRAVSAEAAYVLYSENAFTVGRSDPWGLRPLRAMSGRAIASLRCLTLRLNDSGCTLGGFSFCNRAGMPRCHPLCASHGPYDRPVSSGTRQGRALLRDWHDLAGKLAAHLPPGRLHLDLVCDTGDLGTAEQVVGPLHRLPVLRACSVRLGSTPNWTRQMLGRTAVLRLLGTQPRDHKDDDDDDDEEDEEDDEDGRTAAAARVPSYYVPSEILSRILAYSDLVAPYDLEWQAGRGFPPYDCCTACTATLDACACARNHAAHATTCTCWTPPIALFLVSRRVYAIALTIFYGRNRFVVLPRDARLDCWHCCDGSVPQDAPLAQFLRRVPPPAQRRIRFLGLACPPLSLGLGPSAAEEGGDNGDDDNDDDDKEQRAWKRTVDLVRQRLDVRNLQLSLYVGSVSVRAAVLTSLQPPRASVLSACRRRLRHLRALDGLRDFFVYLDWPYATRGTKTDTYAAALERATMGASYDAAARGKWAHTPRLWYDGRSQAGAVRAPDGTRVWPPREALRSVHPRQLFTYAHPGETTPGGNVAA